MKKIYFMSVICSLFAFAAHGGGMIRVEIHGRRMAPNFEDVSNLRALVGGLVAQSKVKRFEIVAYGIEGGFMACVEADSVNSVEKVLVSLNSLKVDEVQTSYSATQVASCE